MLDKLTLVSWSRLRPRWSRSVGGHGGLVSLFENRDALAYVQGVELPQMRGCATAYRVEFNPNRMFEGREYGYSDVYAIARMFWDDLDGPGDVMRCDRVRVREVSEEAGILDWQEKFRVRVSRYDLNSDMPGEVDFWMRRTARVMSQRWALYGERGRLNGFYIGKYPLVRTYQKLKSPGVVRIELQDRPSGMLFGGLQRFFEPGFRLSVESQLTFAETSYEGNRLKARAFTIVRETEGLQEAMKLLTRGERKQVVTVGQAELARQVDEGYWKGFTSWDDVKREGQEEEAYRTLVAEGGEGRAS